MARKVFYLAGNMKRKDRWRFREEEWLKNHGALAFNPWNEEAVIAKRYDIPPTLLHNNDTKKLDLETRKGFYRDVLKYDFKHISSRVKALVVRYVGPTDGTCAEIGLAFHLGLPIHVINVSGKAPSNSLLGLATTIHDNFEQWRNYAKRQYGLRKVKK